MKNKKEKTNAIRILEQNKIEYLTHSYSAADALSGMEVAAVLERDPGQGFKTLVTTGGSKEHYVFMIPVNRSLNLKRAAKEVQEKSIEMIRSKDLLPLTGYVHGGCSPIGMKKQFKTVLDSSAQHYETILFSGGRIGCQVEVTVDGLKKIVPLELCDISDPSDDLQ